MVTTNSDLGTVRAFNVRDVDRILEIAGKSLSEYYSGSLFMDLFQTWPEGFFVYTLNEKVVGFLVGSKFSQTEARILILAIEDRYRHMGFGKALLTSFIKVCEMENLMSMRLEVRTDNKSAIMFYKKNGFVVTSTLKGYYSDLSDAYLMWRII
jgi:ribosomal-protein-alanine N-acetyltransferase